MSEVDLIDPASSSPAQPAQQWNYTRHRGVSNGGNIDVLTAREFGGGEEENNGDTTQEAKSNHQRQPPKRKNSLPRRPSKLSSLQRLASDEKQQQEKSPMQQQSRFLHDDATAAERLAQQSQLVQRAINSVSSNGRKSKKKQSKSSRIPTLEPIEHAPAIVSQQQYQHLQPQNAPILISPRTLQPLPQRHVTSKVSKSHLRSDAAASAHPAILPALSSPDLHPSSFLNLEELARYLTPEQAAQLHAHPELLVQAALVARQQAEGGGSGGMNGGGGQNQYEMEEEMKVDDTEYDTPPTHTSIASPSKRSSKPQRSILSNSSSTPNLSNSKKRKSAVLPTRSVLKPTTSYHAAPRSSPNASVGSGGGGWDDSFALQPVAKTTKDKKNIGTFGAPPPLPPVRKQAWKKKPKEVSPVRGRTRVQSPPSPPLTPPSPSPQPLPRTVPMKKLRSEVDEMLQESAAAIAQLTARSHTMHKTAGASQQQQQQPLFTKSNVVPNLPPVPSTAQIATGPYIAGNGQNQPNSQHPQHVALHPLTQLPLISAIVPHTHSHHPPLINPTLPRHVHSDLTQSLFNLYCFYEQNKKREQMNQVTFLASVAMEKVRGSNSKNAADAATTTTTHSSSSLLTTPYDFSLPSYLEASLGSHLPYFPGARAKYNLPLPLESLYGLKDTSATENASLVQTHANDETPNLWNYGISEQELLVMTDEPTEEDYYGEEEFDLEEEEDADPAAAVNILSQQSGNHAQHHPHAKYFGAGFQVVHEVVRGGDDEEEVDGTTGEKIDGSNPNAIVVRGDDTPIAGRSDESGSSGSDSDENDSLTNTPGGRIRKRISSHASPSIKSPSSRTRSRRASVITSPSTTSPPQLLSRPVTGGLYRPKGLAKLSTGVEIDAEWSNPSNIQILQEEFAPFVPKIQRADEMNVKKIGERNASGSGFEFDLNSKGENKTPKADTQQDELALPPHRNPSSAITSFIPSITLAEVAALRRIEAERVQMFVPPPPLAAASSSHSSADSITRQQSYDLFLARTVSANDDFHSEIHTLTKSITLGIVSLDEEELKVREAVKKMLQKKRNAVDGLENVFTEQQKQLPSTPTQLTPELASYSVMYEQHQEEYYPVKEILATPTPPPVKQPVVVDEKVKEEVKIEPKPVEAAVNKVEVETKKPTEAESKSTIIEAKEGQKHDSTSGDVVESKQTEQKQDDEDQAINDQVEKLNEELPTIEETSFATDVTPLSREPLFSQPEAAASPIAASSSSHHRRSSSLTVTIPEEDPRTPHVIRIQSIYRGYRVRVSLTRQKSRAPFKPKKKHARAISEIPEQLSERLARQVAAIIRIQAIWRGWKVRKEMQRKMGQEDEEVNGAASMLVERCDTERDLTASSSTDSSSP